MKKLSTLGALLAAVTFASAAHAAPRSGNTPELSPLSGVYLGAYGGYDWTDIDSGAGNANLDGWDGGVFAGYKVDAILDRVNGFGIGMNGAVEAFYGVSNSDDSIAGVAVDKGNEWGISFRPGFSVLERIGEPLGVNPYAIMGYRRSEFKGATGVGSASSYFDGFELGIGTQLVAYGDYGIRAEYSHTWYGSKAGFDPNSNDVRIGLSYHF